MTLETQIFSLETDINHDEVQYLNSTTFQGAPLAPATIKAKGFDSGLEQLDVGGMWLRISRILPCFGVTPSPL